MEPSDLPYIAFGFTILIHLFGTVWWASGMNTRLKHLEEKTKAVDDLNIKVARIEVVTQQLSQTGNSTNASVETIKAFLMSGGSSGGDDHRRLKQLVEQS